MQHAIAPYYVTHFLRVLDGVERLYGQWLLAEEHAYLARVRNLPLKVLCLYVRLINRKGPYFRIARLTYEECAPVPKAVRQLQAKGLLAACSPESLPYARAKLLDCFTYPELRGLLKQLGLPRTTTKLQLCEQEEIFPLLLGGHEVVAIHPQDCWPFLAFLFFGELTDTLSGFVVQELGHIVTESQADMALVPQFPSRVAAQDAYRMACLHQQFREVREELPALELLAFWHSQGVVRAGLAPHAWKQHDRMVEKLGRALEREGHVQEALTVYQSAPVAPMRERQVKLLVREGRRAEALALCEAMLTLPCNSEEEYVAQEWLARLHATRKRSRARQVLHEAEVVHVAPGEASIEAAALAHYRVHGWHGAHTENTLWNALFGLLLWDIIYDPRYGSFHQPLQVAPADLYEPRFYNLRADAIEQRLALLRDTQACLALLQEQATVKQNIINPFLGWHEDPVPMLAVFFAACARRGDYGGAAAYGAGYETRRKRVSRSVSLEAQCLSVYRGEIRERSAFAAAISLAAFHAAVGHTGKGGAGSARSTTAGGPVAG